MPHYLIASYFPKDYDPSTESQASIEAIHALNRELVAAGVRRFAGGLSPETTTLRGQPGGEVLLTDGPYIESKEHIGGLAILETANLDEALTWARRGAAISPRSVVEVREIFFRPAPAKD